MGLTPYPNAVEVDSTAEVHYFSPLKGHHMDGITYRCPPCGCSHDHIVFYALGLCPKCNMKLIPTNEGFKGTADKIITPVFLDGALGTLYPKFLYPIFVVSILFSAFLLSISKFNKRSINPYLGGYILIISLYAFKNQIFGVSEGITRNDRYLFLPISFITALGPIFLCYVNDITRLRNTKQIKLLLLIPLAFFVSYLCIFPLASDVRYRFQLSGYEPIFGHVEQIIAVLFGIGFGIVGLRRIRVYKENRNSLTTRIANWLLRFSYLNLGLFTVWLLVLFINYWIYDWGVATLTYNPLWIAMSIVLIWLFLEIISDPKFFLLKKNSNHLLGNTSIEQIELKERLLSLMSDKQLYKNQDLSLSTLSKELDINPRQLSGFINNVMECNFYDFINKYRIENIKTMLRNEKYRHLTIEAIANQSGFKSKSSFNAAFKKQTKMTPKEFLRKGEV